MSLKVPLVLLFSCSGASVASRFPRPVPTQRIAKWRATEVASADGGLRLGLLFRHFSLGLLVLALPPLFFIHPAECNGEERHRTDTDKTMLFP